MPAVETGLRSTADQAARQYGIDPKVLSSLIQQESGWKFPSGGNGGGLGQLEPAAVYDVGGDYRRVQVDPAYNIQITAAYLSKMIASTGSVFQGLRAYRAGIAGKDTPQWSATATAYATAILNRAGIASDAAKSGTGGATGTVTTGNSDPSTSANGGAGGETGILSGFSISNILWEIGLVLVGAMAITVAVYFMMENERARFT